MIENAAYFYAKNNSGNNTKKYAWNHTLETVRSAYKATHTTNAKFFLKKEKMARIGQITLHKTILITSLIQSQKALSKKNLATPKKDAADASSKVPAHQKRRNSSGRKWDKSQGKNYTIKKEKTDFTYP